jgi:D-aminopeptidase
MLCFGKENKNRLVRSAATEEAIVNALLAAEDMEGRYGNKVFALPHKRLQEIMQKNHR